MGESIFLHSKEPFISYITQLLRDRTDIYLEVLKMLSRTGDYAMGVRVAEILSGRYGTSTIKRTSRRSTEQMNWLRAACIAIALAQAPISVRGTFYRLVAAGAIEKSETEYRAVDRLLLELRRDGYIPFRAIADNSRYVSRIATYGGLPDLLENMQRYYRRALWDAQPVRVLLFIEKDALAGVLRPVTDAWDVPLVVCRGFPSETLLYEVAEDIMLAEKPTFVYAFSDYDPSGLAIYETVERRLAEFVGGEVDLHIERVAVTPKQIVEWSLPTHDTKSTDPRAKRFAGSSCELDAIPPDQLRELAEACITRHINEHALQYTLAIEEAERATLRQIQEQLRHT